MTESAKRTEVDHTPGGSPETAAAPAPIRGSVKLTTKTAKPDRVPGGFYSPEDIFGAEVRDSTDGTITVYTGRAMAAARLSLRGKAWSEDDRVECAGHVAAHVTRATYGATMTGTPNEVSRYIEWVWAHPLLAKRNELAIHESEATMSKLMGLAANWRRSELRRRATEDRAYSADMALTGATMYTEQDETYEPTEARALRLGRERAQTMLAGIADLPTRAARVSAYIEAVETLADVNRVQVAESNAHHCKARDVLRSLGLPSMGKAYVAAYVASAMPTASANLTNDERADHAREIATALGYDPTTSAMRQALHRSRKAIPSAETHGYLAHADVLGVTEETDRVQHGVNVSDGDWRTDDRTDACTCTGETATPLACTVHPITPKRLQGARRKAYDGTRSADWTQGLPGGTRDRLAMAAKLREDRRVKG